MAKPFSIQSPEDIAKEYAGNKQRIAQAMQLGVVNPTAGVLAGMFIDRMRSAQMQEAVAPPTVAQQVMGGVPPAPPVPTPPAGGLGATPQAAPPMAPMAPPMPAPKGAPMGMADGGLASLPVSDAMFDEPTNGGFDDSYAGGGLVAFATGGPTGSDSWGAYIEEMARRVDPNIQISGRARTPARNAEVGGVAGSYHLIDAARDIRTPEGMDKSQFIAQLKSVFGPDYDILPSKGRSVHVEPGPRLGEKVRAGTAPSKAPATAPVPERDIGTAQGRMMFFEDAMAAGRSMVGDMPREELERARAYALEDLDPANQEKARKADMWQALAEMGFRMASSKSPFVLQAIGEAATATLPGIEASKKERKAAKDNAVKTLMAVEDVDRKTALAGVETGMAIYKSGIDAEQFEQGMKFKREELGAEIAMKNAALALEGRKLDAEIKAATAGGGLSTAQATERLRMLENQYEAAVEKALAQDTAEAYGAVERSLAEAGQVRARYNAIARATGMPELPMADPRAFGKYNKYVQERGTHPGGRAYTPQRGASGASSGQQADPLGIR